MQNFKKRRKIVKNPKNCDIFSKIIPNRLIFGIKKYFLKLNVSKKSYLMHCFLIILM